MWFSGIASIVVVGRNLRLFEGVHKRNSYDLSEIEGPIP